MALLDPPSGDDRVRYCHRHPPAHPGDECCQEWLPEERPGNPNWRRFRPYGTPHCLLANYAAYGSLHETQTAEAYHKDPLDGSLICVKCVAWHDYTSTVHLL